MYSLALLLFVSAIQYYPFPMPGQGEKLDYEYV